MYYPRVFGRGPSTLAMPTRDGKKRCFRSPYHLPWAPFLADTLRSTITTASAVAYVPTSTAVVACQRDRTVARVPADTAETMTADADSADAAPGTPTA